MAIKSVFPTLYALEHFTLIVFGRQNDVILEFQLGLGIAMQRLEVDDQIVLDSEDGVGGQPRVILGIQLRGTALIFRVCNLECG